MQVLVRRGRRPSHISQLDWFMARVKKTDGCWLWTGYSKNGRYGAWQVDGVVRLAHVQAYLYFVGAIPDGLEVCHRCDVPLCVNPKHLFLGTHKQNMQDAARKGRLCTKDTGNTGWRRYHTKHAKD